MKNNAIATILCVTFLLSGCGTDATSETESSIKTLELAAFKQECAWLFGFDLCTQGRAPGSTEWRPFTIGELDFEWGYEYTIQYRDVPIENPLPDGPSFSRELIAVLSKVQVPAGTEFMITMRASDPLGRPEDSYITQNQPDTFTAYFDETFVCSTPEVCQQVDDIIDQNEKFIGLFTFGPAPDLPVVLLDVICTEENDEYTAVCDQTAGLVVVNEVVDQFSQPATMFTAPESVFAKFTLNNTSDSPIDIGRSLCDAIDVRFRYVGTENIWNLAVDDCDIMGATGDTLAANSQTELLVELNLLIEAVLGEMAPGDYELYLKFYNQSTSVITITVN